MDEPTHDDLKPLLGGSAPPKSSSTASQVSESELDAEGARPDLKVLAEERDSRFHIGVLEALPDSEHFTARRTVLAGASLAVRRKAYSWWYHRIYEKFVKPDAEAVCAHAGCGKTMR